MTQTGRDAAHFATRTVAANLRVDALTAEIVRAFEAQGVQCRLLKGAAIAHWLYSTDDPRSYADSDLLVRPADHDAARGVLERLGFVPEVEEARMPQWWREHAVGWLRPGDSAAVDIHRSLPGVEADDERLWEELADGARHIEVGGAQVGTLSLPGTALHVALHAAQHGPHWGGSVTADLERALDQADEATWRAAAELARRVEATAAFATGLRVTAAGTGLADRLGLPHERPADVALRLGGAPPVALGFEQLARASTLRARIRILAHKIVPPATFMRAWFPPAARSRRGLALAYLWRPLWLLGHAPTGLRTWLRARRS